ncbi:MAG: hypothetical protein KDI36_17295, partial [Pseudomonadales bacterium]|nr:hypothetical protein [Pseudomonadales bacterium]
MGIAEIDLTKYSNRFSSYTELRLHENRTLNIALLNGDVVGNSHSSNGGVSARVFHEGAWGFSSSQDTGNTAIENTIAAATTNAGFLARKGRLERLTLPRASGNANSDFTTRKPVVSQHDKIEFLRQVDAYVVTACPEIVSRQVVLSCLDMEKKLHTSEGSQG